MQSATAHSQSVHQSSPLLLSGRFVLRSEPEPCDSDPRLVRVDLVERPLVAVVDQAEPRGQVDDSRLPEESELVSDAWSYITRGDGKEAGGVAVSMLA